MAGENAAVLLQAFPGALTLKSSLSLQYSGKVKLIDHLSVPFPSGKVIT
ncbi:MAG TPA: hypothetical protein V6D13_01930 [Halomicronema sp.]